MHERQEAERAQLQVQQPQKIPPKWWRNRLTKTASNERAFQQKKKNWGKKKSEGSGTRQKKKKVKKQEQTQKKQTDVIVSNGPKTLRKRNTSALHHRHS